MGHAAAGDSAGQRRRRDPLRGERARADAGWSRRRRCDADRARAARALSSDKRPLAELLELLATRAGPRHFPDERAFDDASWVGNRLAELLPLPLATKQTLLEMDDANARLVALQRCIDARGLP